MRSSFGRRRPFILGGAIFIIIGLALISNAQIIGRWLGDAEDYSGRAIAIAIVGFWILDLANNTVQGPSRALLVDIAPAAQQGIGSSLFSFMIGLGNLVGYFVGHLDLNKLLPFMGNSGLDPYRALFTISMVVLTLCICLTVFTTHEIPYVSDQPMENPFKKIYLGLIKMPSCVARVCVVQFFCWVGWFAYIVYISDWVGEAIYKGDPHSDDPEKVKRFEEGVREASLMMTINAAVTMAASAILPVLLKTIGIKTVYFLGNIFLGVLLLSTLFIEGVVGAFVVISLCGIPTAVTMVLPFTIVGQGVSTTDSGLYMGALNIFVVLPQLLVSVSAGFIIEAFHNNIASVLAAGGVCAFIAAGFCLRLIITIPVVVDVTTPNASMQYLPVNNPERDA
jgi:solute carrier family 45 protein 1/2/4